MLHCQNTSMMEQPLLRSAGGIKRAEPVGPRWSCARRMALFLDLLWWIRMFQGQDKRDGPRRAGFSIDTWKKKNGDGRGLKGDSKSIVACKGKAFCSRKPNMRATRSSLRAPQAIFLHFHPEHQARLPPLKAESSVLSGFQHSAHQLLIISDFKQSGFGMSLTYQLSLYLSAFTKI